MYSSLSRLPMVALGAPRSSLLALLVPLRLGVVTEAKRVVTANCQSRGDGEFAEVRVGVVLGLHIPCLAAAVGRDERNLGQRGKGEGEKRGARGSSSARTRARCVDALHSHLGPLVRA